MKIRVEENRFSQHAVLLKKCIAERLSACFGEEGLLIQLGVDSDIGPSESYEVTGVSEGWQITGSDETGLYYGIGKFLHTAWWSEEMFTPRPTAGVKTPACDFRAMYFSIHNYNWYQTCTTEELEEYVEQLLLWGYNTIICIVPVLNLETFEDPLYYDSVSKVEQIFQMCRKYGLKTGIIISPNQGLKTAPHEFDNEPSFNLQFRGNGGRNLCMSNPKAFAYMRTVWRGMLEPFVRVGLDYVVTWPYDEGGCGCKDCRPWGCNKYCDSCIGLREEVLKLYPDAKFIISTWTFDMPDDEGEYEGFYKRLAGDMSWVDYIMVDAHGEYPKYPLEHEVIKPIVNFPEISMWTLFPWGGFGANPLPKRFQRIWDSSKRVLKGGLPYSEGMYEDLTKIQIVGYYWEPDRSYEDILSEYINYEYSKEVCREVLEVMELIEENHQAVGEGREPDLAAAVHAKELAEAVDARLPERARTAWRWRILYIRTLLDVKCYEYYLTNKESEELELRKLISRRGELLKNDQEDQALMWELCGYYHCVDYNGENHHTHPPVDGGYLG